MKKLYLSQKDCKIFGLCGGIGEMFDIDPTLVRLGLVFLGSATGGIPAVVTYILARVIVPKSPGE